MKLLSVKPSDRPAKKYVATFCMCEGETKCCDKDRKKVNFGAKGMTIKKSNPARRKSFRARHNCKNPGPKWKARYWSCRAW